jgi:octaprenyl-diphosphate synthase
MRPVDSEDHPTRSLDQVLLPFKEDLQAVTDRILSQLTDPVARRVVYLITAGGKRLRPALVLLAGASGPAPRRSALIETATAVELIHTATLIHDDIIDQSEFRRSQPAFHHRWGTERAVLMGDYLYATVFRLLAEQHEPYVMRAMADVCQQLCRGELREVEARFRLDLTEEEYFQIIRDKTASLMGGCCRSGAYLGGCTEEVTERLTDFGITFGIAFQIIDDCLDLAGDPRRLGKSIHTDLDKGALSLPIIYLTQLMPPKERGRLFAPLKEQSTDPAFLARVAKAAASFGAIAKAKERAVALIRDAEDSLNHVPMNGLMNVYQQLAAYAVSRRS